MGLVSPVGDAVVLREADGRESRLLLGEGSAPVGFLGGCLVEVSGARVGRGVFVEDWRVIDAGDGSSGYVGVLRVFGNRLVIDDRNSQTVIVINDEAAPQLAPWAGLPVLLIGHVTGPSTIVPVAWRLLAPDPAG